MLLSDHKIHLTGQQMSRIHPNDQTTWQSLQLLLSTPGRTGREGWWDVQEPSPRAETLILQVVQIKIKQKGPGCVVALDNCSTSSSTVLEDAYKYYQIVPALCPFALSGFRSMMLAFTFNCIWQLHSQNSESIKCNRGVKGQDKNKWKYI